MALSGTEPGLRKGLTTARERLLQPWRFVADLTHRFAPKGLYPRALLIMVLPIVVLQTVLVFVFIERHWELVTRRLSAAVSRDIVALVELYERMPEKADAISHVASERLDLWVSFLPPGPLPHRPPKPFFDILNDVLPKELRRRTDYPFWIDTVGRSNIVEVRIAMKDTTMRVFARRSQTYASNSHIFIVWMIMTAIILLAVAVLFLRNQIRPIVRLAQAAEEFGKGRDIPDFRPQGAREVRRAALAFFQMKERIARQIEQRTTMLAGVSHDLRTVLTRFRLELALMGDDAAPELLRDVDEMEKMVKAYLRFARGEGDEAAVETDLVELLEELRSDSERSGALVALSVEGPLTAEIRPNAFKRLIGNLVGNALRHARTVAVSAGRTLEHLEIVVDDDGPGIPAERRDDVFRPFLRLDDSRNQDTGGTGLGLTIARDIARSHGGDVVLSDSPLGGLRAIVRVPL